MPPIQKVVTLLAFLVITPILPAQDTDRTFRIAVSSLPTGAKKQLHYHDGEKFDQVALNIYKISPPYPLKKDATTLALYKEIPTLEEDQPAPAPDVAIALPAGKKILIVIFPRVTEDGIKLGAHAIDESAFPQGSIYFFNPTELHLAALLGEEKISIQPNKSFLFRPPPIGKGKTLGVQIALHEEEGWRLFSSTRWHLAPTERHLLFFKINPRTNRADYDSLTDYFKPPER